MSTLQQEEAGTWDHSVTRVLESSWHMAVLTQWCTDRRSSHCPQRSSRLWSRGGRRMVGWAEHRPQWRRFSVPGKAARGGLGTLQRIGIPWASPQHDGEEARRWLVISRLHFWVQFWLHSLSPLHYKGFLYLNCFRIDKQKLFMAHSVIVYMCIHKIHT